jgi:RecA-family ATPase
MSGLESVRSVLANPEDVDPEGGFAALDSRLAGELPAESQVAAREGFRSAAAWKDRPVPPREWLVQDWIPGRNATLLFGDGGTGKSLMALQLAVAVAAGRTWLGMHPKAGTAMFLTAEDERAELHRRTDDILRAEGLHYDDLAGQLLWSMA